MFYSHEILTSPEHGVATIWLVATLGSKSIARRLNRRTILDVDVPKACGVIVNPEAPMALRLQGNLLYGVSRVYNQQCGYTLTDVQAMHDRMKTMFRTLPGGGLDPTSGKTRPDHLILPYDPSFLPEINLPGMDLDFSSIKLPPQMRPSQQSSLSLLTPLSESQSTLALNKDLQLDISSGSFMGQIGGFGTESDLNSSAQKMGLLGRGIKLPSGDEEGVLLQPDFEFDEEGNIIELGLKHDSTERKGRQASEHVSEVMMTGALMPYEGHASVWDPEPMLPGEDQDVATNKDNDVPPPPMQPDTPHPHPEPELEPMEVDNTPGGRRVTMRQARRAIRALAPDERIALRNTDLAQWNNEYLNNMAAASKQKQQSKLSTQARKNAALWVYGQGIGSVGAGLGASRAPHPLRAFSGEQLLAALQPRSSQSGKKKRSHASTHESDSESQTRRVRARGEGEEQIGRGHSIGALDLNQDVEFGRRAPPSLLDDHSSQMPWNITASIQSSRHGFPSNILPGFGSDFSSRGGLESAGLGRAWNRLTSASPLAGRGLSLDFLGRDRLSSLDIPGNEGDDLDVLGDFDLSRYLETEMDTDHHGGLGESQEALEGAARQRQLLASSLDQESQNFLEFMTTQVEALPALDIEDDNDKGKAVVRDIAMLRASEQREISFSALLPPAANTRVVATHALMHVLALATKGILAVKQEEAIEDKSDEDYGTRYIYGEIMMRLI